MKKHFQNISTWLPVFPGFYNTIFEYNDGDIEYTLFNNPDGIAKPLKDFIVENVWVHIDYDAYRQDIVKNACDFMESLLIENFPAICKKLTYENLSSPKQYNFINDSVNISINVDFNQLLKTCINHKDFARYLKDRYTSYDGFLSSYPSRKSEWIENAYDDQSHTVGSMLEFLILADIGGDSARMDMYEYCSENVYNGEYIQYDKLIEIVNDEFTFNDDMKQWDDETLESFDPIRGGTFSDQLLTGIGLFTVEPEKVPHTDHIDRYGLYRTVYLNHG